MKKIAFLSTYSLNEPVLKNRVTPFINLALKRDAAVTLVNPEGGSYGEDEIERFRHKALDVKQANKGNFFIRAWKELRLARRVLKSTPHDTDCIFITIPSMFLLFLFKPQLAKVSLLDVRDITWEYLSDKSFFNRFIKKVFRYFAKRKLVFFDYISVTNNAEKKYLIEEMGVDVNKVLLCPNGISLKQFAQVQAVTEASEVNERERKQVLYIGNVGVAQNLRTFIEAAKECPEIDFVVVGKGSEFDRIQEAAKGIANVFLKGRVDWSEIPKFYQKSDILWAQLTPEFSGAVPSKLYEYLATGKRVVYGGEGQATSVLSEFQDVKVIPPNHPSVLVATIKQLVECTERPQLNLYNREIIQKKYIREDGVNSFYRMVFKED